MRETPNAQPTLRSAPTTSSMETAAATEPKSDIKSVTVPAPPSIEPKPEQLTKPALPRVSDRKADEAPPSSEKAKPAPAETSTVNIASAPEKTLQGKPTQGATEAPGNEKRRGSSKGASPRKMRDLAPLRAGPEMIDLYMANGPHIIVVCSELTRLQKLRMGCL